MRISIKNNPEVPTHCIISWIILAWSTVGTGINSHLLHIPSRMNRGNLESCRSQRNLLKHSAMAMVASLALDMTIGCSIDERYDANPYIGAHTCEINAWASCCRSLPIWIPRSRHACRRTSRFWFLSQVSFPIRICLESRPLNSGRLYASELPSISTPNSNF